MMFMKDRFFIILTLACMALASCTKDSGRKAKIDNMTLEVKIARFDSAFWTLDTTDLARSFDMLDTQYPDLTPIFLENIVHFGAAADPVTHDTYRIFRRDTSVQHLYTDVLEHYANLSTYNDRLTLAFRRAAYFFPNIATPRVYAHVSGLNQSVVVGDGFVSMSLDNYMGEEYEIYSLLGIYGYLKRNMTPEKVVPDYLLAWLSGEYPSAPHASLLDDMIYRGKLLYIISILSPETPKNVIMGYTPAQWEWVKANEAAMWGIMVQSNSLYETDMMTKGRFLNDGPFTLPFSQDSPGRGGIYLGWQIVKSYMRSNQTISPAQLMQITDGQTILNQSDYRP